MNTEYIYLDDLRRNKNIQFNKLEAGLKYNCFKCKKEMTTQPFGSYKYCLGCFNKWEKHKKVKPILKNDDNTDEFID